jgi:hypothetical protein
VPNSRKRKVLQARQELLLEGFQVWRRWRNVKTALKEVTPRIA